MNVALGTYVPNQTLLTHRALVSKTVLNPHANMEVLSNTLYCLLLSFFCLPLTPLMLLLFFPPVSFSQGPLSCFVAFVSRLGIEMHVLCDRLLVRVGG